MKITKQNYLILIVLSALVYMPIFGHLDDLTIRLWDESRLAINAYEMFNNGNYLVTHHNGNPDMWNTKPPLLIWCQVAFMHLIGCNELAVRLPSAFAALFTCFLLMWIAIYFLKDKWLGFIAVLVLITTEGYINHHATRTGDYDAMLTLFTTAGCFSFFLYCETLKRHFLYGVFVFFMLGVLTKSVACLMFLPALAIYAFVRRQVIPLLKNKHFYLGLIAFLIPVISYYLLREVYNPGYLLKVWHNELGGRYMTVIERHDHEFWFYYYWLKTYDFKTWHLLVPCGVIVGLAVKNSKINRLTLFCCIVVVTFFFVITNAQTKICWYVVPLFPFLALIVALFISQLFHLLKEAPWANQGFRLNVFPFILLFVLMITPYQKAFNKTYAPHEFDQKHQEVNYFLRNLIRNNSTVNRYRLIIYGNNSASLFYVYQLQEQGSDISIIDAKHLKPGDKAVANQPNMKKSIEEQFNYSVFYNHNNVTIYEILNKKQ